LVDWYKIAVRIESLDVGSEVHVWEILRRHVVRIGVDVCRCVGKGADDRGRSNHQDSSQVLLIVLRPVSPSPLCVMSRVLRWSDAPRPPSLPSPPRLGVGTSRATSIREPLRAHRGPRSRLPRTAGPCSFRPEAVSILDYD
jgi:hypothetical protein